MLHFNISPVAVSLFLILIARESICERVKNPDIEKCTLPPLPKTERTDIQASFIKGEGTAG